MATHKSALKRVRQSEKKRQRNKSVLSAMKTMIKKVHTTIEGKDPQKISESLRETASCVDKIADKKIEIYYDLTKPEGDKGRYADYSLAKEVLGWEPSVNLEDGLRETYNWVAELVGSKTNA